MAAHAGPGKQPSGRVCTLMPPSTALSLGVGQRPSGLDTRDGDVGLGLYLRTSVCLISLAPEIQDGGETLITDWWEAEF